MGRDEGIGRDGGGDGWISFSCLISVLCLSFPVGAMALPDKGREAITEVARAKKEKKERAR